MAKSGKKVAGKTSPVNLEEERSTETMLSVAYFDRRMKELQANLATKEDLKLLHDVIKEQKKIINELETKVSAPEFQVASLNDKAEESEQYSRRTCLRTEGVPLPKEERPKTAEEVVKIVKKLIAEAGVTIPDDAIDRAHRIGKGKMVAGHRHRQIIVKFTTFRYRTLLYKARKVISPRYRIYLDLTKERKRVLDDINADLKERQLQNCFAFADINCRLCVSMGESFKYISSYHDYLNLMAETNN